MNNDTSGKRFLSGVTALTLSTVIVKVIGLIYKIPMLHILGAEGMGYFNSAYELYTLFFVVATAGLPVAVSILISEGMARGRFRNVGKIYRVSFSLFFVLGFFGAVVMALFADTFARWLGNPAASFSILLIAPTVFFVSLASAVRGYFQGNRNMIPTAVSQVIEAAGKPLFGIGLALWAVRCGWSPSKAAALAVVGLVVGTVLSMAYLMIARARQKQYTGTMTVGTEADSTAHILIRLLRLAAPITVGALLSNATRIVDMTLILRRLTDIGYAPSVATAMFGNYSTLAVPVFHLPSSLIAGIAVSLVPSLTEAVERGDAKRRTHLIGEAMRLCLLVAVPCSLGLSAFSRQILDVLFSGENESIASAAPLLSMLGLSVLSTCLLSVTGAVLQAHKKAALPIWGMLVGVIVKIVSAYILIGIPGVGMMGAPISTVLCHIVAVGLNFYFIERERAYEGRLWGVMTKPLVSSILAFSVSIAPYFVLRDRLPQKVDFLIALCVCGFVYLLASLWFGAVKAEDISTLPMGETITKVFFKKSSKIKEKKNGKQTEDMRPTEKRKVPL